MIRFFSSAMDLSLLSKPCSHLLGSARVIFTTLIVLMLASLPGCSRGGGSSGAVASQLEVVGLDVDDLSEVKRNQPITVTFSGTVDPQSVSSTGFQVINSTEGLLQGRVEVTGNQIVFYPTFYDGIDDNGVDQSVNHFQPPNFVAENAAGYRPTQLYEVFLPGKSEGSIRGINGRPLAAEFRGSFRTSEEYLQEANPVAPQLASVIEFGQEPVNQECSPNPLLGEPSTVCGGGEGDLPLPLVDPSNVVISLRFSEPISTGNLSPFRTLTVTNVSTDPPRIVPGTLGFSGDLRTVKFFPAVSLGDAPDSSEPFLFEVVLGAEVTDLSGNRLVHNPEIEGVAGTVIDPIRFRFETIDKPGETNSSAIIEDFVTSDFRDDAGTSAFWLGNGQLEGPPLQVRDVDIAPPSTFFLLPQPLEVAGGRILHLILRDELRAGDGRDGRESIMGISWGPQSNFVFASTYPDITIDVGHTLTNSLDFVFATNYTGFPDNPLRVFSGDYETPNLLDDVFHPWPQFQRDFEYNGRSNVILDYDVPAGGDDFQLFRNTSTAVTPVRRAFGRPGSRRASTQDGLSPGGLEIHHHRLKMILKKSSAVSIPYDTGDDNPNYNSAQVTQDEDRLGSSIQVKYFGYLGNDFGRPILTSRVGPATSIDDLDGMRFISFEISLDTDPLGGLPPLVKSVQITYSIE